MTENAIAFVLDFYDNNGEKASDRQRVAITFETLKKIEKIAESQNLNYFNILQDDKMFFKNTKATPGLLYAIAEEKGKDRWRLALSAGNEDEDYINLAANTYAPNEPEKLTKSHNFTLYINYCMQNPNDNYIKHCAFQYPADNPERIMVVSAINTILVNEAMPETAREILYAEHNQFANKALKHFDPKSKEFGN